MTTNPAPAPGSPREILAAYAANSVSTEQVMRALTEHAGWYVPAEFALVDLKMTTHVFDNVVVFSDRFEADPGTLLLFTDREAAWRAEGNRIGLFGGAFRGTQIFKALSDKFAKVSVNPCSPKSESWFFARDAFDMAKLWAQVVEMETALEAATDTTIPYAQLANHPGYMLLVEGDNYLFQLTFESLPGKFAVAFTAPDRHDAFLARQSPETRAGWNRLVMSGASLFRQLLQAGVAGVVINAGEKQHSRVLPVSEFQNILNQAEHA